MLLFWLFATQLTKSKDAMSVLRLEATIRQLLREGKVEVLVVQRSQSSPDELGTEVLTKTRKVCYGNVYLPIYLKAVFDSGAVDPTSPLIAAGARVHIRMRTPFHSIPFLFRIISAMQWFNVHWR